jgi:hypothetical protein
MDSAVNEEDEETYRLLMEELGVVYVKKTPKLIQSTENVLNEIIELEDDKEGT